MALALCALCVQRSVRACMHYKNAFVVRQNYITSIAFVIAKHMYGTFNAIAMARIEHIYCMRQTTSTI